VQEVAAYLLREGDVIVAMDRPWIAAGLKFASVRSSDLPALLVQRVARLRGARRLDTGFLKYLIGSHSFTEYILAVQTGTAVPHISGSQIKDFEFLLPSLPEQRAIAHILGTLDDKIELNRRMNETLEAMARALFKSWFVDFDPVRAKAEGRDPGLPKHLTDVFPDRLVQSELGEIPEGWRVSALSDCVDVDRGLSYKGSGLSEDGVPMHNLNSIYEGGGYKNDGLKKYEGEYKSHHIACAGDLIVANTEQGHHRLLIGYAAIVPGSFEGRSLFSHHIYRVRTRGTTELTPDYLCHLLNTDVMHEIVSGYANGTTVNMLPMDALQTPQIIVPPEPVVTTFTDISVTARSRQEKMIEEGCTLGTLRDSLLSKLVSGELRVKDAERFLGRMA
jgi:type I restriction enzyme S subunit